MTHPENFVLELACELIRRRSLTPDDAGCQDVIAARLKACGFGVERLPFGDVSNLWATHGTGAPLMVLAGHTDVVPPGPRESWTSDPFEPVVREKALYGRGAADMKGALAAMLVATERFVAAQPDHPGTLAFLVTSDEEGAARNGTRRVMDTLAQRGVRIDHCLIGEASSREHTGDTLRIGRRGSLSGMATVYGTQGHVAYPDQADNAAHRLIAALSELRRTKWPAGDPAFPPLSCQVANIDAGTGAGNVIPGEARGQFNFRYPPPIDPASLEDKVETIFALHAPRHEIAWRDSGRPFLSPPRALRRAIVAAIEAETGAAPELSTGGGTSDGRFIAPTGAEVIELGPPHASIHKVDEHVALADLAALTRIVETTLQALQPEPTRR